MNEQDKDLAWSFASRLDAAGLPGYAAVIRVMIKRLWP